MAKTIDPEFAEKVAREGDPSLFLCYQCGTCTASCSSSEVTSFKTRKMIRFAQLGLKDDILPNNDLWDCTTCYTCQERCPRGVEIPKIILYLRNLAAQAGYMADAHKGTAKNLFVFGHAVSFKEKHEKLRESLGLDGVPHTTLSDEKALEDLKTILKINKFDELIGYKEEK